ncbi:aspartate aminotransferase [Candidatus Fermentibacteria bacterium]|nr:MAG: aspartate aminotransferase [Candidatus Fermentibacteria bacterium]PIE53249.1 MAG: aspartate aminotransferase [Candidatus Fermentibacteria bacterium]PIE53478.1 MAG: aspartate aminotransferase [Candidatus Fermentibacteria bacterium]
MTAISKRVSAMQPSPIRKLVPLADKAKAKGISVYHLNIGQPDIPTPEGYWKSVKENCPEVLTYGPSQGLPFLREAISSYYCKADIPIDKEEIIVTTGGSEAVFFAFMVTCDPGDEVICFEPFYTNYNGFAAMAGVKLVPVTSKAENGFHLPPAHEIEEKITNRTKAILICTPNNPTGTVLTLDELAVLSGLVRKHNLFLLSDEVYRDFVFDGGSHTSTLELSEIQDRVIVMDSISKRFSSCGARLGNLISRNKTIMDSALKLGQARLCPPTIAQYGAAFIYENLHKDYYENVRETYQGRRDLMIDELSGVNGVFFLKPEGAFYATLRMPVKDSDRFAAWMLTDFSMNGETTMVAPAAGFYATSGLGDDQIRIAYVLSDHKMKKALHILREGLKTYLKQE